MADERTVEDRAEKAPPISAVQYSVTGPTIITDATVTMDGPYHLDLLRTAAESVCRAHGAARTTVDLDEGRQAVHPYRDEAVGFEVHRAAPGTLMAMVDDLARRPIDPAALPVFRVVAVVESPRRLAVHLALPHAVADIASIGVVVRDFLNAYAALARGDVPALPEAPQFADHIAHRQAVCDDERTWREGGPGARAAAFWAKKLRGAAPPPFERPRRGGASGERMVFLRERIDPGTRRLLEEVCEQQRCSLFHATLAAFEETVAGLTGEADVTTMCIVHGRGGGAFEDTVGLLISDVVFRRTVGAPSRRAALSAVAADAWLTHMHQDIRISELPSRVEEVARLYRERHFRAMFLQFRPQRTGAGMRDAVEGVRLSFPPGQRAMRACVWPGSALCNVDLVADGLDVELMFDRLRWAETEMRELHGRFTRCLRAYAREPDAPVRPVRR
ncbi:hypothetical protein AGRA3207_002286 [Actinomadura graeca]|uniref:Condensation domain-containing protein n=1 Tax=Actinomadura graeca TaxID=2750812 RepID=A0ABX8QRL4_9ACTN|nr:condensation domain-containing protein [Actinomadura graeca]QXJ21433.1 hypothetical protein AGRA3207_002286 [Actinomadura graeca]